MTLFTAISAHNAVAAMMSKAIENKSPTNDLSKCDKNTEAIIAEYEMIASILFPY